MLAITREGEVRVAFKLQELHRRIACSERTDVVAGEHTPVYESRPGMSSFRDSTLGIDAAIPVPIAVTVRVIRFGIADLVGRASE